MLFDVGEDVVIGGGCVVVVVTCTNVVLDVDTGSTVVEDVLVKIVVDIVLVVTGVDVVASDAHGMTGHAPRQPRVLEILRWARANGCPE